MTPLFKKLNYKDYTTIVVLGAPDSFAQELDQMKSIANTITDLKKIKTVDFAICFAVSQKEVDRLAKAITPFLSSDAVFWFCYPKGTSKKYDCDFNRDTGWSLLGQKGYEPVRAVSVDADWSALRFRKPAFIKTMTRGFARTEEGKMKVKTAKK
jgi:hypothetical protein